MTPEDVHHIIALLQGVMACGLASAMWTLAILVVVANKK